MLAIANYAQSAAAACASTSYCQACASGATSCTDCLSWGVGDLKDKVFAANPGTACTGTMPATWKVTDCKINQGYASATLIPTTVVGVTNHPRCAFCDSKKFLYYSTAATTETCSDTAPTTMTTCLEITNCQQTVCKTNATTEYKCSVCAAGYYPTAVSTTTGFNTACGTVTTAIANCSVYSHAVVGGVTSYVCGMCNTNYAVKNDNSACVSHTTATGCLKLQSDDVNCYECQQGYYFSGATCVNTGITTPTTKAFNIALISLFAFASLLLLQ